ncbi:unnamed protein product, partial [Meganyctiphanes norvegica]
MYTKYMKEYLLTRNNNFGLQSVETFDKCQTNMDHGNIISNDLKKSYLEESQANQSNRTFCGSTKNTFMTPYSHLDLNQNTNVQNEFQYFVPNIGMHNIKTDEGTAKTTKENMPMAFGNSSVKNTTQKVHSPSEQQSEGKEVQLCISETGVMSISGSDTTDHWLNSIGTEACELLSKIESEAAMCEEVNLNEAVEKDNQGESLKRKDNDNNFKSEKRKKVDTLKGIEPSPINTGNENNMYKKLNDGNKNIIMNKDIDTKDKNVLVQTEPLVQNNILSGSANKINTLKESEPTISEKIISKKVMENIQDDSKQNLGVLITNDKSLNMSLTNTRIQNAPKTNVFVPISINSKEDLNKDTKFINPNKLYGSTKKNPLLEKSVKKNLKQNMKIDKSSSNGSSKKDLKGDNSKTYRRTQPYGYKTLKTPPKSWNPTISRERLALGSSKSSNSNLTSNPPRTNKIFKARNAPKIPDNSCADKSFKTEGSSGSNTPSGSNLVHNKMFLDKKVGINVTQGVCEYDEKASVKNVTVESMNSSVYLATTKNVATPTTSAVMITAALALPPCKSESPRQNMNHLSLIKAEIPIKSDPDALRLEVSNKQITPNDPSLEIEMTEDSLILTKKLHTLSQKQTCATSNTLNHSSESIESLKKCDLCGNISQNINDHNLSSNVCSCTNVNNSNIRKDNISNKTNYNNNTNKTSLTIHNKGNEKNANS